MCSPISLIDHIDALTPLPEQQGPTISSSHLLEDFNEVQIAFYLTYYSWSLFNNVSEVRVRSIGSRSGGPREALSERLLDGSPELPLNYA